MIVYRQYYYHDVFCIDIIRYERGSEINIPLIDRTCCNPAHSVVFSDNTRISWTGLDADRKFGSSGYYTCNEGCVDSIHSNCDRQCNVCHNGSSNTDVFQSLYSVTCSYMDTPEGQVELDISIILGKSVISNCCFPSSLNKFMIVYHITSLIMIRGCIR